MASSAPTSSATDSDVAIQLNATSNTTAESSASTSDAAAPPNQPSVLAETEKNVGVHDAAIQLQTTTNTVASASSPSNATKMPKQPSASGEGDKTRGEKNVASALFTSAEANAQDKPAVAVREEEEKALGEKNVAVASATTMTSAAPTSNKTGLPQQPAVAVNDMELNTKEGDLNAVIQMGTKTNKTVASAAPTNDASDTLMQPSVLAEDAKTNEENTVAVASDSFTGAKATDLGNSGVQKGSQLLASKANEDISGGLFCKLKEPQSNKLTPLIYSLIKESVTKSIRRDCCFPGVFLDTFLEILPHLTGLKSSSVYVVPFVVPMDTKDFLKEVKSMFQTIPKSVQDNSYQSAAMIVRVKAKKANAPHHVVVSVDFDANTASFFDSQYDPSAIGDLLSGLGMNSSRKTVIITAAYAYVSNKNVKLAGPTDNESKRGVVEETQTKAGKTKNMLNVLVRNSVNLFLKNLPVGHASGEICCMEVLALMDESLKAQAIWSDYQKHRGIHFVQDDSFLCHIRTFAQGCQ